MENPAFIGVSLFDVRVIMVIYACSHGGVPMSGGDRMDSNTQVLAVRCVGDPVAMSYHARH
jgi:hypothetical protein